jgi:hypothetical protein
VDVYAYDPSTLEAKAKGSQVQRHMETSKPAGDTYKDLVPKAKTNNSK